MDQDIYWINLTKTFSNGVLCDNNLKYAVYAMSLENYYHSKTLNLKYKINN